jgi:hypothetical protein
MGRCRARFGTTFGWGHCLRSSSSSPKITASFSQVGQACKVRPRLVGGSLLSEADAFIRLSPTLEGITGHQESPTQHTPRLISIPQLEKPVKRHVRARLELPLRWSPYYLRIKLHHATGSPQLRQGLAEAVAACWAIGGRLHDALGIHRYCKISGDVGGRTILVDNVEIADRPRLGLVIKAGSGGTFGAAVPEGTIWATVPVAKERRIAATAVAGKGRLGMRSTPSWVRAQWGSRVIRGCIGSFA